MILSIGEILADMVGENINETLTLRLYVVVRPLTLR